MAALTLYVTEPGTTVHKRDERLVLTRNKRLVDEFPLITLEQVVLIGSGIEITGETIRALANRGIPVSFFSRGMELVARVEGNFSRFGKLRFLQARFVDNSDNQLALAGLLIRGKISNQAFVLEQEKQSEAARRVVRLVESLPTARDLDQLRGFEGQAAALYFEALRRIIPQSQAWGFERRAYYPPPDPINALLSLAYSLLTRESLGAVQVVGFDPYLGCFHAINYGRPSLALDVMEEFRPVMDRMVLRLLKEEQVRLEDFDRLAVAPPPRPLLGRFRTVLEREVDDEGEAAQAPATNPRGPTWRLKPEPRNRFLTRYEELMNRYFFFEPENRQRRLREIVEEQVRQISRLVQGESNLYIPFRLG
jgi:CRISPR-associated protein Cas1